MSMHIMVVILRWSSISPKWVHCSLQRLQVIECYPMLHVYVPPPILSVILTLLLATDWNRLNIFLHSRCSGSCETLALSWNTNCCCHKLLFKELQCQNFQEIGHFLPFLPLCLLWWQGDETWQAGSWYLPYCCKQIQQPTPVQFQCEYLY